MGEIGDRDRHALQRVVECGRPQFSGQRPTAFEKVRKDLSVIGGRPFVMNAVCKHLLGERLMKPAKPERPPLRRPRALEKGRRPDQRLDVLHKMVAADIRFEIVGEKRDLFGKTGDYTRKRSAGNIAAAARELLHPDDYAQGKGVAVPAVPPGAVSDRRIRGDPVLDQSEAVGVVDLLQIFHIMQMHSPELIARRQRWSAPVDDVAGHGVRAAEKRESEAGRRLRDHAPSRGKQGKRRLRGHSQRSVRSWSDPADAIK